MNNVQTFSGLCSRMESEEYFCVFYVRRNIDLAVYMVQFEDVMKVRAFQKFSPDSLAGVEGSRRQAPWSGWLQNCLIVTPRTNRKPHEVIDFLFKLNLRTAPCLHLRDWIYNIDTRRVRAVSSTIWSLSVTHRVDVGSSTKRSQTLSAQTQTCDVPS